MNLKQAIKEAETLSQATLALQKSGYTHNFEALKNKVKCLETTNEYAPTDMLINVVCRYEGQSNPGDSTGLLGLKAPDGMLGTLVISHGAQHSHDEETIQKIPFAEDVIRG